MATQGTHDHKRIPRDPRGRRVAPAPDGRGTPEPQKPSLPNRYRGFAAIVLALLVINIGSVLLFGPSGQSRVTVPFSPYLLAQVTDGHVAEITSKGDTITGSFKVKQSYQGSSPTTLFAVEVPSFVNTSELSALLVAHDVRINARSTADKSSLLASLLLGFGPTLLIVGLFVLISRRLAKAGGGAEPAQWP